MLTPEYLEMKKYEALAANNKIYFGNSIPNMFVDFSTLADHLAVASSSASSVDSKVCLGSSSQHFVLNKS